jgi:hypothetical protein
VDAAELNRRLNRAARVVNLAAVSVAEVAVTKALTKKLVETLAEINDAQLALFQSNPELEYHFDPARAPTAFMREVQGLEREAEAAFAQGNGPLARQKFDEALGLEPPPLAYEAIEKRLRQLGLV